ncbi:MAG: hypothetical protein L0221_12875, partial [Chloroflexi bacterium]|nr:hypothetical protein [Chloroflexota bacterium]
DDDAAEVVVVPTSATGLAERDLLVSEGATGDLPAFDYYAVVLSHAPVGSVTIEATADGESQIEVGGSFVSSRELTFTSTDWFQPQIVKVRATPDSREEGIHFSRVAHAITSETDLFLGLTLADVARGLAAAVNGDIVGHFEAVAAGSVVTITGDSAFTATATAPAGYTLTLGGTRAFDAATVTLDDDANADPADLNALVGNARTWTLVLNGTKFEYISDANDKIGDVATELAALVNATGGTFEATRAANVLTVQSRDRNPDPVLVTRDPFTAVLTGTGTVTASGPLSTTHWAALTATLAGTGAIPAGATWTLTLDGVADADAATVYSYVAGANGERTQPRPVDIRLTDDD